MLRFFGIALEFYVQPLRRKSPPGKIKKFNVLALLASLVLTRVVLSGERVELMAVVGQRNNEWSADSWLQVAYREHSGADPEASAPRARHARRSWPQDVSCCVARVQATT